MRKPLPAQAATAFLQFTFLQAVVVNHCQCGKNTQNHGAWLTSLKNKTPKYTAGESSEKKGGDAASEPLCTC